MVHIEIDSGSGFCFGVINAIKKAEEALKEGAPLKSLGDIVHNEQEMNRLSQKGLHAISYNQLSKMKGSKVLFRAHGESPSTYEMARQHGVEIIDASCPVVLVLQKKIKKAYTEHPEAQIVIYGKRGHAEVNGLVGQTNENCIVVENKEQLDVIDFSKDIILFSQTTKSIHEFVNLVKAIEEKLIPPAKFTYNDTICRQVANRIPNIHTFASRFDVILFVSGKQSSNGKVLFKESQATNKRSYFISTTEDITEDMLKGAQSIGICGATSTPKWLMENVANELNERLNNK